MEGGDEEEIEEAEEAVEAVEATPAVPCNDVLLLPTCRAVASPFPRPSCPSCPSCPSSSFAPFLVRGTVSYLQFDEFEVSKLMDIPMQRPVWNTKNTNKKGDTASIHTLAAVALPTHIKSSAPIFRDGEDA